jgi:photosystem II stability/assembly factor-like uncharacterized protein
MHYAVTLLLLQFLIAQYSYEPTPGSDAIYFSMESSGWITGWSGVFRTTDGGGTWASANRALDSVIGGHKVVNACFLGKDTAWVIVQLGKAPTQEWYRSASYALAVTENGGRSFEEIHLPEDREGRPLIAYVRFLDQSNGFVAGFFILSRTEDGGSSWKEFALPNEGRIAAFNVVNERILFLAEEKRLWRSRDGGRTWQVVLLSEDYKLTGVDFQENGVGFVTGYRPWEPEGSLVCVTRNWGESWTFQQYVGREFKSCRVQESYGGALISCYSSESDAKRSVISLLATGEGNNGVTEIFAQVGGSDASPYFVSKSVGFVVIRYRSPNEELRVFKTEDGGKSWSSIARVVTGE